MRVQHTPDIDMIWLFHVKDNVGELAYAQAAQSGKIEFRSPARGVDGWVLRDPMVGLFKLLDEGQSSIAPSFRKVIGYSSINVRLS